MRWLTMALLALAVLSGAAGCGKSDSEGTSSDKIKLGFIVKQPEEPWFQLEWRFADEAAAKYGFELVIRRSSPKMRRRSSLPLIWLPSLMQSRAEGTRCY